MRSAPRSAVEICPMSVIIALAALGLLMLAAYRATASSCRPPRRPRRRPAHRSQRGRADLHRGVHGEDGRFHQALLPGIPAWRGVRQADRAGRLLPFHRRGGDPPARHPPGDAGDRTGLRAAHLRRRLAVRGGVRGLPVRRGDVPPERHPQAVDSGDHRPRRVFLHHGRAARHPADPEHHPLDLLRHPRLGRALARHPRRAVRLRRGHALPATPGEQGAAQRRRLRQRPAQRAGDRR